MTSKDNVIYYTTTAVVFIGIVLISLLFHNPGQPINSGSERENISTIVSAVSPLLTAFATVVLVGVTAWYAHLTKQILKATNKPDILVSLVPHEIYTNSIYLCVQNIGTGPARNIKLIYDGSFVPMLPGTKPLEEFGIFKEGIDYLGPGNKIQIFLFWTHCLSNLPTQSLNIIVKYKGCKPKGGEPFLLDFNVWEGVGQQFTQLEPIAEIEKIMREDIAKTLRGIEQQLKKN